MCQHCNSDCLVGDCTRLKLVEYVTDALDVLMAEADRGLPRLLNIGFHLRIVGRPGRFNKPIRLAPWWTSEEPAVLVADIYNHAIRIVRSDGEVRTLTGFELATQVVDGSEP